MSINISNIQRAAVSLVGAVLVASLFVGSAVVPSEARAAAIVSSVL